MLHTLESAPGSQKNRKRIGRGPGSTLGKTCGRGHKGQKSRSGSKFRIGFEGGQMPLHRRLPKRGFTNIFKEEFSIVNLVDIESSKKLDKSQVINIESLIDCGLVKNDSSPVKILGNGDISSPIKIEASKFSAAAEKKIADAGGTATLIKK
jgi:large subunit ribosomal protein L15